MKAKVTEKLTKLKTWSDSKKSHIVRITVASFLMIVLFLVFLRAPYFGEFIDGAIFDLLFFGTGKYIVYLVFFGTFIALMFRKTRITPITYRSKRLWLFILFVDIFVLIILGLIHAVLYSKKIAEINGLDKYFSDFYFAEWSKTLGLNGEWLWNRNTKNPLLISGGLINTLFVVINVRYPIIIFIGLAITFLVIIIFFIGFYYNLKGFVKIKNKLIRSLGGVINNDFIPMYEKWKTSNSINVETPVKETFVKEKQIDDLYYENSNLNVKELSFSEANNTVYKEIKPLEIKQESINERKANQAFLDIIVTKLEKLFKEKNIKAELAVKKCGPTEVSLTFDFADRKQIKQIKNLDKELVDIFETNVVSINQKGNSVCFSTRAFNESKISITDVMLKRDFDNSELNCAIGIDDNYNPINFDLKKEKNLLIVGGLGSGKLACTFSVITSLLVNKSPNDLQLCIVDSPNSKLSKLNNLPHLINSTINSVEGSSQFFEKIMTEVKFRNKILEANQVESIDEYNKTNPDKKIKDMVICINDINDFLNHDFSYIFKIISYIYKVANKINIFLILVTNKVGANLVDEELIKCYGKIISLKLDTHEESELLINKKDLYKLHKNGDLYIIDPKSKEMITRGLSCFVEDYLLEDIKRHYSSNYEKH
ncbi:FtsK/SpoIIIE domain-containing protein [Mycoplasma bradburyae]|uniref:FtsK/SpoIIIE domain-containing protein n=1 Tax=Mycoplasma bradburyae TaxID=2963128 RepID=UPI0020CE1CAB|nr:FtsK/SpoIIIE domain-containing protein [Mycoplasma bradburyae]UTS70935.1 FtsK/SpoIIIE domain-containing protein [Mycoplasma bradburyae]